MRCEMCGTDTQLYNAEIEGATMQVCKSCGGHGNLQGRVEEKQEKKEQSGTEEVAEESSEPEPITIVVDDYAAKVKQAREARDLSQKEMAQEIGEKKSLLHKIETGKHKPSESLAETLEGFLDVTLLEEYDGDDVEDQVGASDGDVTIGDMVEV